MRLGVFTLLLASFTGSSFVMGEENSLPPVCQGFMAHANIKHEIKEADFDREYAKFPEIEGQPVSSGFAVATYVSSQIKGELAVGEWTWSQISKAVSDIYKKRISMRVFHVDINNNGNLERIAEFTRLPPNETVFSVVINEEDNDPNMEFSNTGHPLTGLGAIRVFENHTYNFWISAKPTDEEKEEPRNMSIYMPTTSPMAKNSGLLATGTDELCHFTIVE